MPAVFSDMILDVQSLLHSYVRAQEQSTYLTNSITASDTTMSVKDPSRLSRGLVEIDDELLWVESSDRNSTASQVVLAPYGRGYLGSTAATHSANVQVTFAPLFPKTRIKRHINDTIQAVGADLFAVGSTTFTFTPNIVTYALPADAIDVLQVSYQMLGPSQMWYPLSRYRLDANANTGSFANGKTIDIFEPVSPGRTVQVKYTKYPSELVNNSDGFAATTGLLESSRDCIVYGAAARITAGSDSALLNVQAIEANVLDERSQPGSGGNLSRQLYQLHKQRLAEERMRYLHKYPTTFHYAR